MNIGKLISMFVVSCLFALSLAMGANVNAQTKGSKFTGETQEKSQKMGKKKPAKHHKKAKAGHHRS